MLPIYLSTAINQLDSIDQWKTMGLYFVLAALCSAVIHYLLTLITFSLQARLSTKQKRPPKVPHLLPLFGLPFGLAWNPLKFIRSSRKLFWSPYPVCLRILTQDIYIVQGILNISILFRQRSLSGFALHGALLRNVFDLPPAAAEAYRTDDSGDLPSPYPKSREIKANNRVEYLTMTSSARLLKGSGFLPLCKTFEENITRRLQLEAVGKDWIHRTDFMDLFHQELTSAFIDSLCGIYLLRQNPTFVKDLWVMDDNILSLFAGIPKLLAPAAFAARDRLLTVVKNWHIWARKNFDSASVDLDGNDPYWGTEFFRERQEIFSAMDRFDANAMASEDLAFLWGVNQNMAIAAFWCCLEVYRDPELLSQVRHEVDECIIQGPADRLRYDTNRLLQQPILQAVYAETLRLRVHGFLVRYPSREDVRVGDWTIPKGHIVLTSTTPGHLDPSVWCTRPEAYPVDKFWPGRFLHQSEDSKSVYFSFPAVKGAWMPYGVGPHACMGRQFAKMGIILTLALLVTLYDCQIIASERNLRMSTRNFGFGALSPVGKVPVKIRRRAQR